MSPGKSKTWDEMIRIREDLRERGLSLAFTNGCFDMLHGGHIHLLRAARAQADALVVALNDDDSIRRLKGKGRPVFPLEERIEVLAALEPVDYLVSFSQDTPLALIAALVPDVLAKGGDWVPERVVGRIEVEAAGGRVLIVPYLEGRSSTALIDRIREGVRPVSD